jgi:glycopeptide antibiotics resistance protein
VAPVCLAGGVLDSGIVWTVVSQPRLLVLLGVAVLVAGPIGVRLSPGRKGLGVLFVLTLGAVLAATTTTGELRFSLSGMRSYLDGFAHPAYVINGFGTSREKIANIGLFLPLGFLAARLWPRPLVVLAALAVLTFGIELWQAFIGRGGDAVDVLHNTVGALVGIGIARLWRR